MSVEVSEVAPGVRRLTLPLDLPSPDHIHCYLLDLLGDEALLVDCGMAGTASRLREALETAGAPSPRVLITHGHVDHWGAAVEIADTVLAHDGVRPSLAYASGDRMPSPKSWPAGLPGPEEMERAFGRFRKLVSGVPTVESIAEGDRIGDWRILWTPGHDPGHVCLYRSQDGVLLTGDLLLPGYTPNIQPPMEGDGDAVAEFLASLRRTAELPIRLVLPAHGEPYTDARARARELIEHHEHRLSELARLLEPNGAAVSELTEALFDEFSSSEDRMLGSLETIAHLQHLRLRGMARPGAEGRWYPNRAAAGAGATSSPRLAAERPRP